MSSNKVLFVDDEINILNSIKRSTMFEDYEALFAVSGEKALEVISENNISVIVSDMKMPNMNGLDLLKRVKEISPDTIRIVLSGYTQLGQILATVNSVGIFKYITKPWNDELDFLPSIREAVNYYALKVENDRMKKELQEKNLMYEDVLQLKNDLIKNIEKDTGNIKKIDNLLLQLQNIFLDGMKNTQSNIENLISNFKLINKIYSKFLTTFPTSIQNFDTQKLKTDLNLKLNNDLNITIDEEDSIHQGNYNLILIVLTELINYLTDKQNLSDISLFINSSPILRVKIFIKNNNVFELYSSNMQFKLIINLLKELIKTAEGDLIIDKTNKEILINIQSKV